MLTKHIERMHAMQTLGSPLYRYQFIPNIGGCSRRIGPSPMTRQTVNVDAQTNNHFIYVCADRKLFMFGCMRAAVCVTLRSTQRRFPFGVE